MSYLLGGQPGNQVGGGYNSNPSSSAGGYVPSAAASSYTPSSSVIGGGYTPSAAAGGYGGGGYTPSSTTSTYTPSSTALSYGSNSYTPSTGNAYGSYNPSSSMTSSATTSGGYVPSAAASSYGPSSSATSAAYNPSSSVTSSYSSAYVPSAAASSYNPSSSVTSSYVPSSAGAASYGGGGSSYQPTNPNPTAAVTAVVNNNLNAGACNNYTATNNYQQPQSMQQTQQQPIRQVTGPTVLIEVVVMKFGKKQKVDLQIQEHIDTLFTIKELAAPKIGMAPHCQIIKYNNRELTDADNMKTLSQLQIPALSTLHITKRPNAPILKVVLHKEGTQKQFQYQPQTFDLEVDFADTTLGDVREIVAEETHIPPNQQVCKFNNKTMDSTKLTLEFLKFQDGAELVFYQKEQPIVPVRNANANSNQQQQIGGMTVPNGDTSIQNLKIEFDKLDKDKSGYLDAKEVGAYLKWLPHSAVKAAMAYADTNKDGRIDFNEYCKIRKQLGGVKMGGKKK